ncbi:Conserved_hypothetical protein [Hexamita inflata]|uniref:Dynein regulatory complex protein 12 n=1 Tax=Hexamita inflata TaxID=28002 RepID=A0ABP1GVY1_9EUKA
MSKKKDEIDYNLLCDQAEIQIQNLERRLLGTTRENADLQQQIAIAEKNLRQNRSKIDNEKADRFDILNDMHRQFKTMQDELLKDISERERNIEVIKQQNQKEKDLLLIEREEKDKIIIEKDQEVQNLKRRLDQLSREFSAILRETLAQIADKIENKTDEAP